MNGSLKAQNVTSLKREEARRRVSAISQVRRNPRLAAQLQKRASLAGGAAKWKIVNLEQSFAAMAKWAKPAR
jgi:hypothetical protein